MAQGTVIARRTRVGGNIDADGDLLVEGRVEGAIRCAGRVTVAVSGVALAEIRSRWAEIAGVVVGNIMADEGIEVLAGARIVGDLSAPKVSIAAGATIEGRVDRGGAEPMASAPHAPVAVAAIATGPIAVAVTNDDPPSETRMAVRSRTPLARPTPPPARRRPLCHRARTTPPTASHSGLPGASEAPRASRAAGACRASRSGPGSKPR